MQLHHLALAALLAALLAAPLAAPLAQAADEPAARALMEAVDARDDGDGMTSSLEMRLIDRRGDTRTRILRRFSRDADDKTRSLIFFVAPADVENTGFLTFDYNDAERDDDQWLYLPALRKTKRIASSDKSGSFMGSDFSYADMTRRDLADYDYRTLKESEVGGHRVVLIEATPRSEAVIDETGYTKSVLFVRPDIAFIVRAVHWVRKGGKLKYFDVRQLEQIDNIWVATETHMTTKLGKLTQHKTELRLQDVQFNQPLDDDLFSVRRLEQGL